MPRLPARITLAQARSAPPVTSALGGGITMRIRKTYQLFATGAHLRGIFNWPATSDPDGSFRIAGRTLRSRCCVLFSSGLLANRRNTLRPSEYLTISWLEQHKFERSHQSINSLVYRYLQYSLTTLFLLAQRLLPQSAR